MKSSLILAFTAGLQLAAAHTTVFQVQINDKPAPRGDGRSPGSKATQYIREVSSNKPIYLGDQHMACNNPGTPVPVWLDVKAGDKISALWHHDDMKNNRDPVLDPSHHGPVQVYIAPSSNITGNSWVKIASDVWTKDGHDPRNDKVTGTYGTDRLISKSGVQTFTMPSVAAGNYLLRPEIIALHGASKDAKQAQMYMACIQVKVSGNGSPLPAGIKLPDSYTGAPGGGLVLDLYIKDSGRTYKPPGGPVVRIG
ncbi:hypothetical protein BT63DRAFT_465371 [Microthyrium microscopicum]|uniref:AA9 family lytic polysaccharide monooxygenase n=1 Tax=Microthyrium microscopicum TaxID=703497 RepID=A0A6A6TW58_9PEZI|nr:hypothetical protein BT63DRAFT_465371 [Microthyrium microscopicum]